MGMVNKMRGKKLGRIFEGIGWEGEATGEQPMH
jgi:hypothetical protein